MKLKVSYFEDFKNILETVYGMTTIAHEDNVALLEVGEGGNGGQVILIKDDKGQQHVKVMVRYIMCHFV